MTTDYFDKLAEEAVRDAIHALAAAGKRPTIRTVPAEAARLLQQKGRGRLAAADGEEKVAKAIDRLRERKDIRAPLAPTSEWVVVGHEPPPQTAAPA
jgi:hypothetical protein